MPSPLRPPRRRRGGAPTLAEVAPREDREARGTERPEAASVPRAAARHEKKRSRVRRRAATLVAEEAASPRTRPRGAVVDGLDDIADSEEARTELASALARAKAEDDSASDFSS